MKPETRPAGGAAPDLSRLGKYGLELALGASLVVLLGVMLWGQARGLDLTDEAAYLLAARSPERMVSVLNFGEYTGVLYRLSAEQLDLFRWLGTLCLLASAGFFAWGLAPALGLARDSDTKPLGIVVLGFGALGFYSNHWIPSPGYHWLALVGTLVGLGGVGLALRRGWRIQALGCFAFGGSGVVVFAAKPPSAVALAALGVFSWGLVQRRRKREDSLLLRPRSLGWRGTVAWGFTGFMSCTLLHMLCFDSPGAWVRKLTLGYSLIQTLGGHEGVLTGVFRDLLRVAVQPWRQSPVWWAVVPCAVLLATRRRSPLAPWVTAFALLALVVHQTLNGQWAALQGAAALNLTVALAALGVIQQRWILRTPWRLWTPSLVACLFVCSGVLVTGYASNTGLVWSSDWAVVFYAAGGACLIRLVDQRTARVYALGFALGIGLATSNVFQRPYRLNGSLWEQTESVGGALESLRLDSPTAQYLEHLRLASEADDFVPGTVLIDLSGDSPGAVLALQGSFVGHGWYTGGVSGSNAFARRNLELASADELASAWILTAPGGALEISPGVLRAVGLDFPARYTEVTRVRTPKRPEQQILYRPTPGR